MPAGMAAAAAPVDAVGVGVAEVARCGDAAEVVAPGCGDVEVAGFSSGAGLSVGGGISPGRGLRGFRICREIHRQRSVFKEDRLGRQTHLFRSSGEKLLFVRFQVFLLDLRLLVGFLAILGLCVRCRRCRLVFGLLLGFGRPPPLFFRFNLLALLLRSLLTRRDRLVDILLGPLAPVLVDLELLETLDARLALGAEHVVVEEGVRDALVAERGRAARRQNGVTEEFRADWACQIRVGRREVLDVARGHVRGDLPVREPGCAAEV